MLYSLYMIFWNYFNKKKIAFFMICSYIIQVDHQLSWDMKD